MRLNEWHKQIISHRPTDCILEVAYDSAPESGPSDFEKHFGRDADGEPNEEAMIFIETTIDKWLSDGRIDVADLTETEQFVLWDIIDGSTTAACCVMAYSGGKAYPFLEAQEDYKAVCRAGKQLAREYSKYHGQVNYPVV